LGSTNTNDSMAVDIDFIAYKPGVHAPVPMDPTYNPAPTADAGPVQAVYIEDQPIQLAGTASDEGSLDGTTSLPGIVSAYWAKVSGPGTPVFTPASPSSGDPIADILNSTVTFDVPGDYELMLQVFDDEPKDANDTVFIRVRTHADDSLVGYWPFDGDALDYGDNAEKSDGTPSVSPIRTPPIRTCPMSISVPRPNSTSAIRTGRFVPGSKRPSPVRATPTRAPSSPTAATAPADIVTP